MSVQSVVESQTLGEEGNTDFNTDVTKISLEGRLQVRSDGRAAEKQAGRDEGKVADAEERPYLPC